MRKGGTGEVIVPRGPWVVCVANGMLVLLKG